MSKVAVWLNNFNNERHLRQAFDSVLMQTFTDFTLYVFDNHSTDGAPGVIQQYASKDPRIQPVPMPMNLAGIPAMAFAWDYLNSGSHEYSITLGGHDYWPNPQHLEILVARMEYERARAPAALIYTDTWQVNDEGALVGHFNNILQQGGNMGRPFVPQWVVSGIDCPPFFGLWNEEVRRQVPVRHTCAGFDHLVVTHAAVKGQVLYEPSTRLVMRAPAPGDGLDKYGKRHFSPAALTQGHRDFLNQLEWLNVCIDEACAELGPEKEFYRAMLTTSMFSTYVCLRGYNLAVFPGGMASFSADPRAQRAIAACLEAAKAVRELTA